MKSKAKGGGPIPLEDQLCYSIYSASIAIQRVYKPLLDELGLTYPQYLVLNVLWRADQQTVGAIADQLGLESSTLTPVLKRLEAAGLVHRARNPENERQVLVNLTEKGDALRTEAGCLGEALLTASGDTVQNLAALNADIRRLRDALYAKIGGWSLTGD
ncbi:Organic hydroperoxide resistance transcriptional regulator [Hyphomicrobium sulfonivorans]|uniref:Organic hydroperoxide resistance transcriptional regulator n=1 Tax=Hyphomicrobium sulfonivorans TaxID=121290 RepID=A0A109BI86_HYPSL|nr:MarR family transcriptional regulator [Hyphomicrobium sulfonivorans]KWT69114.1 Organic hydroperoxide resistance transcriptional regulator [Hyphomicrobium sulfonivorans]